MATYYTHIDSLLGKLLLVSDGKHLTGLYMEGQQYEVTPADDWIQDDSLPVLVKAKQQLAEYFSGDRKAFDISLMFAGSQFQKQTWSLLNEIPYGTTATYGALAHQLGDPEAARTVGHTIGMNPISVIIPCHRVVSSTGKLTGYNGGLERKRLLLDLEAGRQQLAILGV